MSETLAHYLDRATLAAREAGKIQLSLFREKHTIHFKGEINLVTEVDRACEDAVVRILQESFPDHDFLLEEGAGTSRGSPFQWIVDPVDGTTNYAHGYPHFCCSIALRHGNDTLLGVVFDPCRDELFTAVKGQGALLNGAPIAVSKETVLIRCLLGTGFPYDIRTVKENNLDRFSTMILHTQGVRRSGSAALDLCYLAAGRLDGYWIVRLDPWDVAAGILMIEESGGTVTDLKGAEDKTGLRGLVASNGKIQEVLLRTLVKE